MDAPEDLEVGPLQMLFVPGYFRTVESRSFRSDTARLGEVVAQPLKELHTKSDAPHVQRQDADKNGHGTARGQRGVDAVLRFNELHISSSSTAHDDLFLFFRRQMTTAYNCVSTASWGAYNCVLASTPLCT